MGFSIRLKWIKKNTGVSVWTQQKTNAQKIQFKPTGISHSYQFMQLNQSIQGLLTPSNPIRLAQLMSLAQMARVEGVFGRM